MLGEVSFDSEAAPGQPSQDAINKKGKEKHKHQHQT
ncbi:MAG: hypothetical protein ACJAWQ_000754 [Paraglaciecola sp.]|jgi:hypothetical protein